MSAISQIAPNGGVLVASASPALREQVLHRFHDGYWQVQEAKGGAEALYKLETGSWQLLFLDRKLPDLDADELVQIIKRRYPGIEVVLVDSDNGKAATQPWLAPPQKSSSIPPAAALPATAPENFAGPVSRYRNSNPLPGMIGSSSAMQRVFRYARMVAPGLTTVLITGPTGTGKELVARALHQLSPRASRPFVVVNCAAIPEALLESELFGHARGAFTGAVQAHSGRILAAQGGTLFLDEVGELSLVLQAKLLRFLDRKEVQRLGSIETLHADVRVLAATNVELGHAVDEKKFRGDLFYRLSAFPIELPPLAGRREDIVPLAEHFLHQLRPTAKALHLSEAAKKMLLAHAWNGNVRELQQVMERALILAEEQTEISADHLYIPEGHRRWEMTGRDYPQEI
jgi:DNA-binding NtrC family response regulator